MTYLITGGCGFLGSNIAAALLAQKHEKVVVFDNLSRLGSSENLRWLRSLGPVVFVAGDTRNQGDVDNVISTYRPEVIFHLAGQVAMTTSIANPRLDFETNAFGSFNVIDAVRRFSPSTTILYSSTNKVYGDLEWAKYGENASRYYAVDYPDGFPETIPLSFHSPYGCTKGSADQLMLDAYRIFGIKTVVFRHSSMFGGRQFSTTDQGWIGWFCQKALEQRNGIKEPFTISGTGKQVRDVLFADDMVSLYLTAAKSIDVVKGQAFNVGGGMPNSLSLLELFSLLESELGVTLQYRQLPPRESDQKVFVADIRALEKMIGWKPQVGKVEGLRRMLRWVGENAASV